MDGDGVTREGALHLQLGSGGVTRGRSVSMLATSPAAAALTAHHHPAQGSQPGRDKRQKQYTVNNHRNTETLVQNIGARTEVEKLKCKSAIWLNNFEILTCSTHSPRTHIGPERIASQLFIHPNVSRLDRYVHAPRSISPHYARL